MKPVAFVVLASGTKLSEEQVKQFVLENAPVYQHPRMVIFMDALPLAGPGKIDRNGLLKKAGQIWAGSS